LPVKIASTLDSYLENRFQRNFMNGVLNLIAFIALLVVGIGYLISGWTLSGGFFLGLGMLSLLLGIWDLDLSTQSSTSCKTQVAPARFKYKRPDHTWE
jgi:hypothetical protein